MGSERPPAAGSSSLIGVEHLIPARTVGAVPDASPRSALSYRGAEGCTHGLIPNREVTSDLVMKFSHADLPSSRAQYRPVLELLSVAG